MGNAKWFVGMVNNGKDVKGQSHRMTLGAQVHKGDPRKRKEAQRSASRTRNNARSKEETPYKASNNHQEHKRRTKALHEDHTVVSKDLQIKDLYWL